MYKIVYSKNTLKEVKKLDSVVKKKLGKTILRYSKNPLLYAKKLTSSEIGSYRWRVGNYRVVFDLKSKTIEILKIGHRRDIYKK